MARSAPENEMQEQRPVRRGWSLEALATALLVTATVATAWGAYQATRWSGVMASSYARANTSRSESVRLSTQAGQAVVIDVQSYLAWFDAVRTGDATGAAAVRARFRPEFATVFDAWLGATSPAAAGQLPPGTPFDRADYRPAAAVQSQAAADAADAASEAARTANQTADNYVLIDVLLAVVLFLAGGAIRRTDLPPARWLVGSASVLLGASLVTLAISPISFGI